MKKFWKVYAQCCRSARPIKEITKEEAENCIIEAVDSMVDIGDIDVPDIEDDNAFGDFMGNLYDKAISIFDEKDMFNCGDYMVCQQEEMPDRPNICGYDSILIK